MSSEALSGSPIGACRVDDGGTITRSADACAGTGARRVLVTLRAPATCSAYLGRPMDAPGPDGVAKEYLFAGAPDVVRERYCVLRLDDSAASAPDDWAERLVASQCGGADVEAIARDCSGRSDAASSHAPSASRPRSPSLSDTADMPNGCDVCATSVLHTVYFVLPPSFVTHHAADTMVVRVGAPTPRDWTIRPPVDQQTFTVETTDVPAGAPLTVYPSGVTPETAMQ